MSRLGLVILARIVLILVLAFSAYYVVTETPFFLLFLWLCFFFVLAVYELIRYTTRINYQMSSFLMAIKEQDFTSIFPKGHKKNDQLVHAFNLLTAEYKKLKEEKESNFHFLQTVVEHSGVPLLAYNMNDGNVRLANHSFLELFEMGRFRRIQTLGENQPQFVEAIQSLENEDKILLKLNLKDGENHLSILAKEIKLFGKKCKVIATHSINSELDHQELESWNKLIQVLNHEIKNTAIPISTLSEVLHQMLLNEDGSIKTIVNFTQEEKDDLAQIIQTIEKRSIGLVNFVTSYSDMSSVPKPDFQEIDLREFTKGLESLFKEDFSRRKIPFSCESEKIVTRADEQMLQQVMVNLIKNAIEASEGVDIPKIEIKVIQEHEKAVITVFNAGSPIPKEIANNIFTPFYTTKQEGSGIGLSLSRQYVRANRGTLRHIPLEEGTKFEIRI